VKFLIGTAAGLLSGGAIWWISGYLPAPAICVGACIAMTVWFGVPVQAQARR
jgi:hypothetical protein